MNEKGGGANAIRSNNHGRKIWWESDGGERAEALRVVGDLCRIGFGCSEMAGKHQNIIQTIT
jgi:hypothetical protein